MTNTKIQSFIYWFATAFLCLALLGTGVQQLLRVEAVGALAPPFAWGIVQLGYPLYFLTIISVWKLLAVIAFVIPGYTLLKEWAYAGIFFLFTGALFSHIASGQQWYELIPATLLLAATIASWYFRPANRKLTK